MEINLAQTKIASEYQLKAAFLYNFTRFIDWPSTAFSTPNAPFVIGIIGNDPFGVYMDEIIRGETVSGRPIIIQRYSTLNDIRQCHILYINTKDIKRGKEIISALENRSILTVSDASNFVKWGGVIGFYKEGNKVRLQINVASARAAQIEISSKLLNLARIFDPGQSKL